MDKVLAENIIKWYEEHQSDQIWTGKEGYNLFMDKEIISIVELAKIIQSK